MGEADGQTYVQVTNAGGSGAATLNGIELITVRAILMVPLLTLSLSNPAALLPGLTITP